MSDTMPVQCCFSHETHSFPVAIKPWPTFISQKWWTQTHAIHEKKLNDLHLQSCN